MSLLRWFCRKDTSHDGRISLLELGDIAEKNGEIQDASRFYREAIREEPSSVEGYLALGGMLFDVGDLSGANNVYEEALGFAPDHPVVLYNIGNIRYLEGKYSQAELLYRKCIVAKPDHIDAHIGLSNAIETQGKFDEAIAELDVVLGAQPLHEGALFNKSLIFSKQRRYEDAEDTVRKYLAMSPNNIAALRLLAASLWGQGLCSEALTVYRFIGSLGDSSLDLLSHELFLLNYDEQVDISDLFSRHQEFGRRLESKIEQVVLFNKSTEAKDKVLKVGYISADFNWHPVAFFLLPVVEKHCREFFTVYCYHTSKSVDNVTAMFSDLDVVWRDVSAIDDEAIVQQIISDDIDLLVDLSGHTATSCLGVFARRPAPVQVTWLGYLNTTGLTRIHYRLCDARTDPLGESERFHTETLVRLPNSQWCYRPFVDYPINYDPPYLRNGWITFGCYNHSIKISSSLLDVWVEILSDVPNSRLLCVGMGSSRKMSDILSALISKGVDGDRISFTARENIKQYYALYNESDIALDTFPFGGGTTTFDTLWMGVPVVAAKGSTPASRSAASILEAVGLDEWVAPSIDDYVRVAVERAHDFDRIKALRRTLRSMLQTSPLMDEKRFVRDLETAYREMWHEYCDKAGPFARTPS